MKNKGNDGLGDNPERDLWETKQQFFDTLNKQYNFQFDCCANGTNKKAEYWSNSFEDIKEVTEIAWMNPPFSKAFKMFEHFFKVVNSGVAIYRCDNIETRVWQQIILEFADWIFIPKGRLAYTPYETFNMRRINGTRFPSALIGIKVEIPRNIEGQVLLTQHEKRYR